MKKLWIPIIIIAGFLLAATSQGEPQARVVRMMLDSNPGKWRFSVDGAQKSVISDSDLTNKMVELNMRQGDLILLGSHPNYTNATAPIWRWLAGYCESNRIATYHYRTDSPLEAVKLFSIPVYNWTAPFENPRSLTDAAFFREGHFLGCGPTGFSNILDDISRARPKMIFILGSLYDMYGQFGRLEHPYYSEDSKLNEVLKSNETDLIIMTPEYGL